MRRAIVLTIALLSFGVSTWRPVRRLLRRVLSRFVRLLLRWRSQEYPIDQDLTALIIAPHPDDEALGCSGIIARKRIEGVTVRIIYLTDGGASHPKHPTLAPETLVERRQSEAQQAMTQLGVERAGLVFLGAPDGALPHLSPADADTLVRRLAESVNAIAPDEIILPCERDGSSEHEAAFLLVRRALALGGQQPRVLEFPVWSWWNPLLVFKSFFGSRRVWRVTFPGYQSTKRNAVALYRTQTEPIPPWPQPVLSAEFISYFTSDEEFFFER